MKSLSEFIYSWNFEKIKSKQQKYHAAHGGVDQNHTTKSFFQNGWTYTTGQKKRVDGVRYKMGLYSFIFTKSDPWLLEIDFCFFTGIRSIHIKQVQEKYSESDPKIRNQIQKIRNQTQKIRNQIHFMESDPKYPESDPKYSGKDPILRNQIHKYRNEIHD